MVPYASVYLSPQLLRIQTDNDRLFVPFIFTGSINGVYSQFSTYFLGEYDYTGNLFLQFYIWARLQVMTFYLHKILQ